MTKTLTPPKLYKDMTEAEREAFRHNLFSSEAMLHTAKRLEQEYSETSDSMYGADPRYPGEVLEWTADGHVFIVEKQKDSWVRLREVL